MQEAALNTPASLTFFSLGSGYKVMFIPGDTPIVLLNELFRQQREQGYKACLCNAVVNLDDPVLYAATNSLMRSIAFNHNMEFFVHD